MPGSTVSASNSEPRRLLLVGVNWIGDTLMAMPAVQAWRRAHPRAHLAVLARPAAAALWQLHDAPDEVIAYDKGATWKTVQRLRAGAYDAACVLPNSFRSALLPFLAGIPSRRGAAGHLRRGMLTRVVQPALHETRRHQAFEYADLLLPDAPLRALEVPALRLPESACAEASALLAGLPRPLLAVMPGAARGPSKRWPAGHFLDVARRWQAGERGGVLLVGGPGDAASCADLASALGPDARSLAGDTSLAVWAALLAAADAAVANDSGGMHLAAALGKPVAAVFGMTDPAVTGPLGPRVRILQAPGARSRAVARHSDEAEKRLAAISPEQVYEALVDLRRSQPT